MSEPQKEISLSREKMEEMAKSSGWTLDSIPEEIVNNPVLFIAMFGIPGAMYGKQLFRSGPSNE